MENAPGTEPGQRAIAVLYRNCEGNGGAVVVVVYEGPSELNGAPIVAIITGLVTPSTNTKTGPMAQLWILDATTEPHVAVKTGEDESVCGDCPARNKWCYVTTFKGRSQFTGHGNVEDIKNIPQIYSSEWFSDSVLMETQLQFLLKPFEKLEGGYVALLVTPMPGSIAIANFDTTAWPQWIRSAIRQKLLDAGGVPSVCALQILEDYAGNPYVLPVMKQDTKSPASIVELVTDDGDPA